MKAEIHGSRLFVKAETKQDLTDVMTLIKRFPEADTKYWLVLDLSEVDKSCDIRPFTK